MTITVATDHFSSEDSRYQVDYFRVTMTHSWLPNISHTFTFHKSSYESKWVMGELSGSVSCFLKYLHSSIDAFSTGKSHIYSYYGGSIDNDDQTIEIKQVDTEVYLLTFNANFNGIQFQTTQQINQSQLTEFVDTLKSLKETLETLELNPTK